LEISEYPLVGGSGVSVYNVGGGASASSAASTAGDDGDASDTSSVKKSAASLWGELESGSASGGATVGRQRIVVFVVGGITLAETRAMAELEKQYNCDVLIGGSTILTPKRLVEILLAPTP
jgi:hypothetical protein